jgi:hypothetical protein
MYAVGGGQEKLVKLLMEMGAKVDYKDRLGVSPKDLAVYKQQDALIALLALPPAAK